MKALWPLFATVAIGCSTPLEYLPAVKIVLETKTTLEKDGPHVTASLRNAGQGSFEFSPGRAGAFGDRPGGFRAGYIRSR